MTVRRDTVALLPSPVLLSEDMKPDKAPLHFLPFSVRTALRLICLCFAAAFLSLLPQYHGLLGMNGLEPASKRLGALLNAPDPLDGSLSTQLLRFRSVPSLLLFSHLFGVSIDVAIEGLCLVGFFAACAGAAASRPSFFLLVGLTAAYGSLFIAGGTFLGFQWDLLLLEAGWLAAVSSPLAACSPPAHARMGAFASRFAAAKLLLMSGVVKITARCPTWSHLSATQVHFASQPLPTPPAWALHSAPPLLLEASVAATLWAETFGALLLLAPHALMGATARFAVGVQVALQALIIFSGNYTFFNWLTIALCLFAWPADFGTTRAVARSPDHVRAAGGGSSLSFLSRGALEGSALVLYVGASVWYMFDVSFPPAAAAAEHHAHSSWWGWFLPTMDLRLHPQRMSAEALERALDVFMRPTLAVCAAGFVAVCSQVAFSELQAAAACARQLLRGSVFGSCIGCGRCAVRSACFAALCAGAGLTFCASAASLWAGLRSESFWSNGGSGVGFVNVATAHFDATLRTARDVLAPYHVSNGYGLFRQMTGVAAALDSETPSGATDRAPRWDEWGPLPPLRTARPEVVIEGLWRISDLQARDALLSLPASARLQRAVDGRTEGAAAGPFVAAPPPDGTVFVEIELPYKPGNVFRAPPWVAPHQPRLDWQMWFAALGSYSNAPWFVHFVDKLLEGSPEAYSLVDLDAYPVRRRRRSLAAEGHSSAVPNETLSTTTSASIDALLQPPLAIRATLFHYDFVRMTAAPWASRTFVPKKAAGGARGGARKAQDEGGAWWTRTSVQEFFPLVDKGHAGVAGALSQMGWQRAALAAPGPSRGREGGGGKRRVQRRGDAGLDALPPLILEEGAEPWDASGCAAVREHALRAIAQEETAASKRDKGSSSSSSPSRATRLLREESARAAAAAEEQEEQEAAKKKQLLERGGEAPFPGAGAASRIQRHRSVQAAHDLKRAVKAIWSAVEMFAPRANETDYLESLLFPTAGEGFCRLVMAARALGLSPDPGTWYKTAPSAQLPALVATQSGNTEATSALWWLFAGACFHFAWSIAKERSNSSL